MNNLRVAVIGCGHWGPNHIRNFANNGRCDVVAAVDLDPVRLERTAQRFPGLRTTSDIDGILTSPEVDAVVIATPTATHWQLASQALKNGKHVLCEKPLTLTSDESADLIRLAETNNRILMVGHIFLFNPGIVYLKNRFDSGDFGRVFSMDSVRTNLGPFRNDIGAIYDLASHDFSIFNYLVGAAPISVSAQAASFLDETPHEDVGYITLKYPDNVVCNAHVSWLNPRKVRQMTVVSDSMMAVWDDMEMAEKIRVYDKGVDRNREYSDFGQFQMLIFDNSITIPRITPSEPLAVQTEHFVCAVLDGAELLPDGQNGLDVVRALEACTRSIAQNGAFVDL
jgi:predicted dehydrogenase